MKPAPKDFLHFDQLPKTQEGTLLLAFSGWMDGGDVSTGTVRQFVDLLGAAPVATIDPEPFYIYNFPGSMEVTALFRPPIKIEDGLVTDIDMPTNTFYYRGGTNLVLFLGKEPNLHWRSFGECIFQLAQQAGIRQILFVGSFGGSVPHTRSPHLYVTCSDAKLFADMEQYGLRRSAYEGPGSFTSYLMAQAPTKEIEMASLVVEIPGYLQGTNPLCIEAVTRRLANILKMTLDFDSLRNLSTAWELQISTAVEKDEAMSGKVRELEERYDNELLELDDGQ